MKKVLILGASGMLGTSMVDQFKRSEFTFIALNRKELDITCYSKIRKELFKHCPDYVINCAAYTAVDLAEEEPEEAHKINATAVGMLASLTKQINATLIHFSTDYVFDGTATEPYTPDDVTNPINVYGHSKLMGEKLIKSSGVNHYIFRISWLYAPHGKNFFRWVIDSKEKELKVVDSQLGCPTSSIDVAEFVHHVIQNDPKTYGIYHYSGSQEMTWYDFAKLIVKENKLLKTVVPIDSFPSIAKRPRYSVMKSCSTDSFNLK